MDFNTNFKCTAKYHNYLTEQIGKDFLLSPDGIPVSKEFPEKESNAKGYNRIWRRKPEYGDNHLYFPQIVDLARKYTPNPSHILEVGAGFGSLAVMLIEKLAPQSYTAYEFSKSHKKILEKFKTVNCQTNVVAESFRELPDIKKFDTIIATEIFEHIFWDIEFILKIPKGVSVFFSVPVHHAKNHVRAFLLPDSVWFRYKDFLKIYEINAVNLHEDIPKWWCVGAMKK